jgi:hypothetical protein
LVCVFIFQKYRVEFCATGSGEDPPPARRLLWFESGCLHFLVFARIVSPDDHQTNDAGNGERNQGGNQKHPGLTLALPPLPAWKQDFSQKLVIMAFSFPVSKNDCRALGAGDSWFLPPAR